MRELFEGMSRRPVYISDEEIAVLRRVVDSPGGLVFIKSLFAAALNGGALSTILVAREFAEKFFKEDYQGGKIFMGIIFNS